MEKVCKRCTIEKDLDDFNYKASSKDKRQPYCRECSKEDYNERYGREDRVVRNRSQRETVKHTVTQFLANKKCALCGSTKELVLQPRSLVSSSVSRKYSAVKMREILLTTKTTVFCAKCNEEVGDCQD